MNIGHLLLKWKIPPDIIAKQKFLAGNLASTMGGLVGRRVWVGVGERDGTETKTYSIIGICWR